jgi:hypothetical protein
MKLRTIINILISGLLSRHNFTHNFTREGLLETREISYNFSMKTKVSLARGGLLWTIVFGLLGCVTKLPSVVDPAEIMESLVVGRVVTVLTGDASRRYPPEVRFFELENQESHRRFQVEIESADKYFTIDVPPGTYRLTRVQIGEGPFRSMADLAMAFSVDASAITYVGTWRFGVDSPRYGRMIAASVIADQEEAARVRDFLDDHYPAFEGHSMVETVPQPTQMKARLYEVMPYPRYPRYFRRHWW